MSTAKNSQFPGISQNPDPLLCRKKAALYLGVAAKTLAVWASTKRYPLRLVKIGGKAMYKQSELDAFIAARVVSFNQDERMEK